MTTDPCKQLNPILRPEIYISDIMAYIKGKPKKITTTDIYGRWLMNKFKSPLVAPGSTYHTHVLMADSGSPPTKEIHTHTQRDAKHAVSDSEEQHQESCEFDPDEHIILNGQNQYLPKDWAKYTSNRALMRRELYPFILSLLTNPEYMFLPAGKVIVTSGIPFFIGVSSTAFDGKIYQTIHTECCAITEEMEQLDPELYNRGGLIRYITNRSGQTFPIFLHIPEYDNAILEADLKAAFFIKVFNEQTITLRVNDRDFIPISLAVSIDRHTNGIFDRHLYLQIPNLSRSRSPLDPQNRYIIINDLYMSITNDPRLEDVYNKVISIIFIIIMVGCDHTRKFFLRDINPVKHVLETFYANPQLYSHMVQLSNIIVRDPNAIRVPLVDERAAIEFTTHCYIMKYGEGLQRKKEKQYAKDLKKWQKAKDKWEKQNEQFGSREPKMKRFKAMSLWSDDEDDDDEEETEKEEDLLPYGKKPVIDDTPINRKRIRNELKRKNKMSELPLRTLTRRDIRYCVLTLYYYLNGARMPSLFDEGGRFDIFKIADDGLSYWGYKKNKQGKAILAMYVSTHQNLSDVPAAYIRHMLKGTRKKRTSLKMTMNKQLEKVCKKSGVMTIEDLQDQIFFF